MYSYMELGTDSDMCTRLHATLLCDTAPPMQTGHRLDHCCGSDATHRELKRDQDLHVVKITRHNKSSQDLHVVEFQSDGNSDGLSPVGPSC